VIPRKPAQYLKEQTRWRLILVFGGLGLAIVLALASIVWHRLVWISAVSVVIAVVTDRASRPGRKLDPLPYAKGARGEMAVAVLLGPLASKGYRVLHDLDTGHGNVDHVVIGPSGAYAIETKEWEGRFYQRGGRLFFSGRDASEVLHQATRGAMEVGRRLKLAGIDTWVEAVVVSTRAVVVGGRFELHPVTVLSADRLVAFVDRNRKRLDPNSVARAVAAVLRGDMPRRGTKRQRVALCPSGETSA
jgi:hypothetical protein